MRHPYQLTEGDLKHLIDSNKFSILNSTRLKTDIGSGTEISGSVCSVIGTLNKGEDTFVSFSTPPTPDTLANDMEEVLKDLHNHASTQNLQGGSTASVVAVTPDLTATCTNVGDSRNVAFVWHANTGKVTAHPLNKLHYPGETSERERLTNASKTIVTSVVSISPGQSDETVKLKYSVQHSQKDINTVVQDIHNAGNSASVIHRVYIPELDSGLSMSRAINDTKLGIDATPETTTTNLSELAPDPQDRIFLLSATDGLFDMSFQNLENYCQIIQYAIRVGKADVLADIMCKYAQFGVKGYNAFSTDDKTAVCTEIPKEGMKQTYFQGVFDGHRGKGTSTLLRNRFASEIAKELGLRATLSNFYNRFQPNLTLCALDGYRNKQILDSTSALSSIFKRDAVIIGISAVLLAGMALLYSRTFGAPSHDRTM